MTNLMTRRRASAMMAQGLVGAAALLQGCDRSPRIIKVGVAQPLTGDVAAQGNDLLNGVKLAVQEINAESDAVGGGSGRFEIVAVDDRADTATAVAVAHKLVAQDVVAVIGHLNSDQSIAAAPVYADKHIAQLSISTNPKLTELGLDTTFRLVANDLLQAKAMGSFCADQFPLMRYALFDDGSTYGKDLIVGVANVLNTRKIALGLQQSFDEVTVKFDDVVAKLKDLQIGVLITTLSDFQMIAMLESLAKIKYTQVKVLGSDTIKTTAMLKGSHWPGGLYCTSQILEADEFSGGKVFLGKYRTQYKIEPAYAAHYAYDAMHVLAVAVRTAGSAKPQDIVRALRKIDGYAPVTGSMKWNLHGEQRYGVVGVYAANAGNKWEPLMRSHSW